MILISSSSQITFVLLQEQQGYLVDCLVRRVNGSQGIKFVVESTKHPDYIEQRISRFLSSMTVRAEFDFLGNLKIA